MNKALGWLVIVAILAIAFTARFWMKYVTGLSVDEMGEKDWLNMADFMTNMLTPLLAFLSLCVLAWTLKTQNDQIHLAKNANTITWLSNHVYKLEDEILLALRETEVEVEVDRENQSVYQKGSLYEVFITKSVKMKGSLNPARKEFPIGDAMLEIQKLIEISTKLTILEKSLIQLAKFTSDSGRARTSKATFGELRKQLEKLGYMRKAERIPGDPIADFRPHREQ